MSSGENRAAAIAAAAAIVGTIVGGLATYLGNSQLQQRQLDREEAQQTAASRAVARLLRSEYKTDVNWLVDMTDGQEYEVESYRERAFVSRVGQDDRKLLARRLSEGEWTAVSNAQQMIERVEAELEIHHGRGEIGQFEEKALREARRACVAAFGALAVLARG